MTTFPLSSEPGGDRTAITEFRPSASVPLPRMRSVGDFVALANVRRYITVQNKFLITLLGAGCWTFLAFVVTMMSFGAVADAVSWPIALLLVAGVVWVPSFLSAFSCVGLVLDEPPPLRVVHPTHPVTVVVTALNQPRSVAVSLGAIAAQDYDGPIRVLVVDCGSTDSTVQEARGVARQLGLGMQLLVERGATPALARNAAVQRVDTPIFVALDAGTTWHPSAVRMLVARLLSSPNDTAAVVGNAMMRNRREGSWAELRAADYSVMRSAHQRARSLFQGPLVADGTCGAFRTDAVLAVNGWSDVDDDGVVITWRFLERGWRVFHEPHAVVFADEELGFGALGRHRARSAWAVIDAVREAGVQSLRFPFSRFVTRLDMAGPIADTVFSVGWLLTLLLLLAGHSALFVLYPGFVVPMSIATAALARRSQREALEAVGLSRVHYPLDSLSPVLTFHCVQAPAAACEYVLDLVADRRRDD